MSTTATFIAMILLTAPTTASPDSVTAAFAEQGLAGATVVDSEKGLGVEVAGGSVMTLVVPMPVPEGEAEHGADNNVLWTDGAEAVKAHGAHLLVVGSGLGDGVAGTIAFTKAVAALATSHDAIGVYWGAGSVSSSTRTFAAMAKDATAKDPPTPLWVGLSVIRDQKGRLSVLTLGLSEHGFDEFWVVVKDRAREGTVLEFVYDLCHYALSTGTRIKPGETVGASDAEKLKVKKKASPIPGDKSKVLYFEY